MSEEEQKTSRFSSGLNIIQRLDQLWKNCHSFKRNGLFHKWNDELDSVWLELARDLSKSEYYDTDENGKIITDSEKDKDKIKSEGYESQFEAFEKRLNELMPFVDSGGVGFKKPEPEQIEKRNKQYQLLMEKQLFLARLENEVGKGTSWEDEDDIF